MKNGKYLKSATLIALMTAQILFAPTQALGQSGGFAVTPIVKRGDAVSDGGRFFDCNSCEGRVIGLHALNNRGDVAIDADVIQGACLSGRFLISEGKDIKLVDSCRMTPFGRFSLFGPINVNDQGQAAIHTGVIINDRFVNMLLLYSEGEFTQIVKEGDTTPVGTIIKGCGFGQPAINNNGDVAFHACAERVNGSFNDGVFVYSNGIGRKVIVSGDPSPFGGPFVLNFFPAQAVQLNDNGDVLFVAGVRLSESIERLGLFIASQTGFTRILFDGDRLPTGSIVTPRTSGSGDLNDRGEAVFTVGITGGQGDRGTFLYSNGEILRIAEEGDSTPIGGKFKTLGGDSFITPRINDSGTVAFLARVTGGSASSAIFLASPQAIVKVAAIGDALPTGGKIKSITSFALNDFNQVAFYAEVKNGPKGVFLATPLAPEIRKIKLKRKRGRLELRVDGTAMITGDTVIEINGVALDEISYPQEF
ncbi:MAG: choice-of-anchor tandem repeat NxxGxxAF-containing protein, partial [Acidobacteriota bacterium]